MTRETKIGLLVGLAFIVVFAMLLSHTGSVAGPGEGLQLARGGSQPLPPVVERPAEPALDIDKLLSTDPGPVASPTPPLIERPAPSATSLVQLPTPDVFETSGSTLSEPLTETIAPQPETTTRGPDADPLITGAVSSLEGNRVAPPLPRVPDPVPTPRDTGPVATTATPQPSDLPVTTVTLAGPSTPSTPPVAPPAGAAPREKEYVVKKGQTLLQIAREVYGDAYAAAPMKVMEFLLKSNKDNVKNKHFVVEGQKLSTPALPAELFEPVTNLNLARSNERVANLDSLINRGDEPGARQAPAVKRDATEKKADAQQPRAPRDRVYEVRANETFSSIAREQLGSEAMWREIQKMNKNIDPARMKPGTMIKLPARRPAQQASSSGKNSA